MPLALGAYLIPASSYAAPSVTYTGDVTPNQSGANWEINDIFHIGQNSAGTLDILEGGTVVSGDGRLAQTAAGVGTVKVDGLGSSWQANSVDVGRNGAGTLLVTNQAQVIIDTSMDLGRSSTTASGSLLVDGAGTGLSVVDAITVGNSGSADMTISNGALVTSRDGYVARNAGSSGTVLVTNVGSRWETSRYIFVGHNGDQASLIVSDGGVVSAEGVIDVGRNSQTTTATALITGANSKLMTTKSLNVGHFSGNGLLTAEDSAQVISPDGFIGREVSGTGVARITDNASWSLLNSLNVGFDGNGTLEVNSAGSVSAGSLLIGVNAGSIGQVSLTDAGSVLHTDTEIVIGAAGSGSLSIDKGALLAGDSLLIAQQVGSTGTLHLRGNDTDGRGVLAIGQLNNSGSGTAIVDFDGGVLRATRDEADFLSNFTSVNLNTGGLVVDSNGFDLGINSAFAATGGLIKQGVGTLTLNSLNNSYSGLTEIRQGTLRAGAANVLSPASSLQIGADGIVDLAEHNQSIAGLTHSGTLVFSSSTTNSPHTLLTVTGPYLGNNGILAMSTQLDDNNSATDRLLLSGPSAIASGQTSIRLTDAGGLGAQTTGDGIVLVATENGAALNPNSFSLEGLVVEAGAYEYRLFQNAEIASLQSHLQGSDLDLVTYRPEVALLSALPEQFRQADLAMLGDLQKRTGSSAEQLFGSARDDHRVWSRVIHVSPRIEQKNAVNPESRGDLTGLQIGADLYASEHLKAGLYVGQLEGKMNVRGFVSGLDNQKAGSNTLRNRYVGLYSTWQSESGLYADVVVQRADYHSRSKANQEAEKTSVNGHGWLASVEIGKPYSLNEQWQIQPEAQVIYRKMKLDKTALSAATVSMNIDDDWLLRVGAQVSGNFSTSIGKVQPYGRVNLYKSTGGTDVASFTGPAATSHIATKSGYNATELAVGTNWQVSNNTQVYGEIGKLWHMGGGNSRVSSGAQVSLGLKVSW